MDECLSRVAKVDETDPANANADRCDHARYTLGLLIELIASSV